MFKLTKMTKWDKALIVIIIVASILGLYFVKSGTFNSGTKYVIIEVDGKEYKKISFGSNIIGKTIDINTEFGYNKIEFGNQKVRVVEADCPNKLDVKQGWISSTGEVIVCLPNRLVVQITTENQENENVDYISY